MKACLLLIKFFFSLFHRFSLSFWYFTQYAAFYTFSMIEKFFFISLFGYLIFKVHIGFAYRSLKKIILVIAVNIFFLFCANSFDLNALILPLSSVFFFFINLLLHSLLISYFLWLPFYSYQFNVQIFYKWVIIFSILFMLFFMLVFWECVYFIFFLRLPWFFKFFFLFLPFRPQLKMLTI